MNYEKALEVVEDMIASIQCTFALDDLIVIRASIMRKGRLDEGDAYSLRNIMEVAGYEPE